MYDLLQLIEIARISTARYFHIACTCICLASSSCLRPCPWQYIPVRALRSRISFETCAWTAIIRTMFQGGNLVPWLPRVFHLRPRTVVYCCQVASSFIYSLQTSTNDGNGEVNVKPVRQRPLIRYGHMMPHTTLVCQHVNVSTVINPRSVHCTSLAQSLLTELLFLCNQLFNF
jgi:hypothetical protein